MPRLFERFHRIENAPGAVQRGQRNRAGAGARSWWACTAAPSTRTAPKARAPRSPSGCPSAPRICPPTPSSRPARVAPVPARPRPYVQEALRWMPADAAPATVDTVPRRRRHPSEPAGPASRCGCSIADDNADMRDYLSRLLRGDGYARRRRHRRPAGVGRHPRRRARPRGQRRDDASAGRARPGGGAARRSVAPPPCRCCCCPRAAGRRPPSRGLQAGADDYLVKPFAAAELLARVRGNVELARLRNHHARWRTALVESLQEAFFVCDEHGAVIEINAAFTDILGFGADGLPVRTDSPLVAFRRQRPRRPPAGRGGLRGAARANARHLDGVPVNHRDGHRLWVNVELQPRRRPRHRPPGHGRHLP